MGAEQRGVMPSLLDRLTGLGASGSGGSWYTITQMVESVKRDLESLLNTEQTSGDLCPDCPEAERSMISYGLPDLGSLPAHTMQQRAEIGLAIEKEIQLFEPRLREVRVELVGPQEEVRRTVHFRIVARLRVEPAPEVVFDTVLELTSGRYSVRPTSS